MEWRSVVRAWTFAGLLVAAGCGGSNGTRPDATGAGGIGAGGAGATAVSRTCSPCAAAWQASTCRITGGALRQGEPLAVRQDLDEDGDGQAP